MKETITLTIDIDTDTPGNCGAFMRNKVNQVIVIRKDPCGAAPLPALAHELGHVLARLFALPADTAYVKTWREGPGNAEDVARTCVAAEHEAWEMARLLLEHDRDKALATYEGGFMANAPDMDKATAERWQRIQLEGLAQEACTCDNEEKDCCPSCNARMELGEQDDRQTR